MSEKRLKGRRVLVTGAGTGIGREIALEFARHYAVNVRAPFFLTQAVAPAMRTAGAGAVINITSIHAFQGKQEHSVYAGTRGAIVSFNRQLAIELAPCGIRVNAIAPGSIEVENTYTAVPGYDPREAGKGIPSGFVGQPIDIARVAAFLASDDARYIVGQTLIVDGGTTSWMPFGEGFRGPLSAKFGQGYVPGL